MTSHEMTRVIQVASISVIHSTAMPHNCDLFVTSLGRQLTFILSLGVLYSYHDFNAHLLYLVDGKHTHLPTFQTWEMSLWSTL